MNPSQASPALRLAVSRERLRQALRDTAARPRDGTNPRTGEAAAFWREALKSMPGASSVLDAAGVWWSKHPLHMVGVVAANAVRSVVMPLARRHPLGLVFGALLLGGLVAWSRPWRWIAAPVLLAGLIPEILVKVMGQSQPLSWIALLNALMQQGAKSKD